MITRAQHLQFDKNLEGLRGICALTVAIAHIFTFKFFDSDTLPGYGILLNLQFARVAVLLFFLISGYVIGINHFNTPVNLTNVKTYLKKRLIRLYPNYILSLALSIIVLTKAISTSSVIAHILFLQEFWVDTISSNVVLWSLSYEVFYYLLFLLLWALNKSTRISYIITAVLALGYVCVGPNDGLLKSLTIGAIFWAAGLYISQQPSLKNINGSRIFAYLAVMLATHALNSGVFLLQLFHLNLGSPYEILISDMVFLPACLIIICEITNRSLPYLSWIKTIAFLIPVMQLFLMLYLGHDMFRHNNWALGLMYTIIALGLAGIPFKSTFFETLASTGKISYAIYIFHFPIAYGLNYYLSSYLSGTAFFVFGVILFIGFTGSVAVIMELILQPKIKKYFTANRAGKLSIQSN